MNSLKCASMTEQEARKLAETVLATSDFDLEFDCGRVYAVELKDGLQTDMHEIVARSGWQGFTEACEVFCATGYQYWDSSWDILVVE